MPLTFKTAFVEHYSKLTDFAKYKEAVLSFALKAVRVNTLKTAVKDVKVTLENEGWALASVPWCDEGFYVKHTDGRRDISNTDEHRRGLIFIQKSVSMLPACALRPKAGEAVLDICAAPGAKTTQMAAMIKNEGVIVANESASARLKSLYANLQRCSVLNTVVTQHSGDRFPDAILFDKILVDAPCSGTGLIKGMTQRSEETLKTWNLNMVRRLAKLQKRILCHAYSLLKSKGTLVYSTCSLEPDEDENVVEHLLEHSDAKLVAVDLPVKAEKKQWIKVWPQDQGTEGFFVAKFRKL